MIPASRLRAVAFAAFAVASGCAPADAPEPTRRAPRGAEPSPAADLPPGETVRGLVIPGGSEHTVSTETDDDFVVPFDAEQVTSFVSAQLEGGVRESRGPGITEFRRATPKSADPAVVRLYVLVMPFGESGTLVRVRSLPAAATTPEELRRNLERFEDEQRRLD